MPSMALLFISIADDEREFDEREFDEREFDVRELMSKRK